MKLIFRRCDGRFANRRRHRVFPNQGWGIFHQFTLWIIQITGGIINGKGVNALFRSQQRRANSQNEN